jgi:hypothetical protein
VLLPEALQVQAELPEEVTVIASPELAREETAALMIAGRPAVDAPPRRCSARGTRVAPSPGRARARPPAVS